MKIPGRERCSVSFGPLPSFFVFFFVSFVDLEVKIMKMGRCEGQWVVRRNPLGEESGEIAQRLIKGDISCQDLYNGGGIRDFEPGE